MSDLIKREDAIEVAYQLRHKPNDEEWAEWRKAFNAIPSADRPRGEWKVISKTINTTLVSCSECGKRFHIPNYCFKSERDRWKCCPICCADMRGEDNE